MLSDEKLITIAPGDGSEEVMYTVRGLKDDEVNHWTSFCASVFAYKANPPPASYFGRHFYNDPLRSASLIRVIICNNGNGANNQEGKNDHASPNIVASCRVFRRTISLGGGSSVFAGGIGEVCTDSNHRRRGLSKLLLQDAIRIMAEQKMQLSLLHAAPAFFPVYESCGYSCTTSQWSRVSINLSKVNDVGTSIRSAQFPADTDQLMALHQRSSERRFCGTIIRTKEYWNNYISKELEGSLWVLINNKTQSIVAWLSIRCREANLYQLREFGHDKELTSYTTTGESQTPFASCFGQLLYRAVKDARECESDAFNLILPTAILRDIDNDSANSGFVDWDSETSHDDQGWMYRTLPSSDTAQPNMPKIEKQFPHLVWPVDSF